MRLVKMDDLKMEEGKLEEQLNTFRAQLTAVTGNLAIKDDTDSEVVELITLESDLNELISLTQESLLEIKKQILLASLDMEINKELPDNDVGEMTTTDLIEGKKCRAPFAEEVSWRGVSYHNAIILCEEPDDKVRVLYTHPLFDSMKPCSFFLEGNCKFSEDSCRYSHGHVVPVDQLDPYTDPQYSCLHSGSHCLAKRPTDDLWHDAIVKECGRDLLTVQFTTAGGSGEIEISLEDVLPLSGSEDSDSVTSSSDDENGGDGIIEEDSSVRVIDWKPSTKALGEWEQYTTGIGSKLLAKMGYVSGKGLGRDNQGRVEPVPIEILPAGKSLDACAAIKEERKLKEGKRRGKRKKNKRDKQDMKRDTSVNHQESMNVFDFLNTQLGQVNKGGVGGTVKEQTTASSSSCDQTSVKDLNVELFKIQENISGVEKKIKALTGRSRERKDKRVEEYIRAKLKSANNELANLRKQERLTINKVKRKSNETKLTVF